MRQRHAQVVAATGPVTVITRPVTRASCNNPAVGAGTRAASQVRIPMSDGMELAATLYLPDTADPQPCLLEALPYRKDDLTSSYARRTSGCATGTGTPCAGSTCAAPGRRAATRSTSTSPPSSATCRGDTWLAAQEWCDGQIGMWGTSYSGFNSLQMALRAPPALKAICAIYATDDRWTDDVHWRGGALRLVDLVDYDHYMTAMNVLPPVPAVWGPRVGSRSGTGGWGPTNPGC